MDKEIETGRSIPCLQGRAKNLADDLEAAGFDIAAALAEQIYSILDRDRTPEESNVVDFRRA